MVHDDDIDPEYKRKAVSFWEQGVQKFKLKQKITKFVTRKTLADDEKLKTIAQKFVQEVKPLVKEYGPDNVYNSGESGFQLEIHSGQSLACEGQKKVECVV